MNERVQARRSLIAIAAILFVLVAIFAWVKPGHTKLVIAEAQTAPVVKATPPTTQFVNPVGPFVYLTFDDGPDPTYTSQVLDVLEQNSAHATFFEVGRFVDKYPALSKRAFSNGNSVQNHTYSHHTLRSIPQDLFDYEVNRDQDAITNATGVTPTCVRPPYDESNQETVDRLNAKNLKPVAWSVDTLDWKQPGVDTIVHNAIDHVAANQIILFHDGGGDRSQTVAALQQIIPELRNRGFGFAVLCR